MVLVMLGKFVEVESISLNVSAVTEEGVPKSEILFEESNTGIFIEGVILEAAFKSSDKFLLFVTDDIPQEDSLSIYLLSDTFLMLDQARLGGIYTTGSFKVIDYNGSVIYFRFFNEAKWQLTLLDKPTLRLPIFSEPAGVSRKLGLTRHFKLESKPFSSETANH